MKKVWRVLIIVCLWIVFLTYSKLSIAAQKPPKVLILNSYHQGYYWSDTEVKGIEATLYRVYPAADLLIEYMDTKRNFSASRFDELRVLYEGKYQNHRFDLVILTDDNALRFFHKYHASIFQGAPAVFCGVNKFSPGRIKGIKNITGVAEVFAIHETLQIMARLHPAMKKVVVIADATPTAGFQLGAMRKALEKFSQSLELEVWEGLPVTELENRLSKLPADSIPFRLAYNRDRNGVYTLSEKTMQRFVQASPVPIYGLHEHLLGYGLAGGYIIDGYAHGTMAARLGVRILQGEDPSGIPVVKKCPATAIFDYQQMVRFGLNISDLPQDAVLMNFKEGGRKEILVIHSYGSTDPWTLDVMNGITDGLKDVSGLGPLAVEYMDSKHYFTSAYYHKLYELYKQKYGHRFIDLVIVSDDHAFRFMEKFGQMLFKDTPVVFCSVNYLGYPEGLNRNSTNGIIKMEDIKGTVNAILNLHPKLEKILVIGGRSTAGQQGEHYFEKKVSGLDMKVQMEMVADVSMEELLEKLARLDDKTAVLLLSFRRDKNNRLFSDEESTRLITQACNRPIYGFSTKFLGLGMVGGNFSHGFDQGKSAAVLGLKILNGEHPSDIPVQRHSSRRFVFDYEQLQRFGISTDALPPGSALINQPQILQESFKKMRTWAAIAFYSLLLGALLFLQIRVRKKAVLLARLDSLTGAIDGKHFDSDTNALLEKCSSQKTQLVFCRCTVNQLKHVKQTFDHQEKDNYVINMFKLIKTSSRTTDFIYRLGEDEFMIIFVGRNADSICPQFHDIQQELTGINLRPDLKYLQGIDFGLSEFDPCNPKPLVDILRESKKVVRFHETGFSLKG